MKAWLLLVAAFLLWPGFSSQNACEEPDEIDFGEIVSAEKAKYLENDRVQYRCNPGYVLEGSEWIQCNRQEWTPHPPKCLAPCSITRQQLTTKNLFVFGNQRKARLIQSDHSLQFQCNEGYVLVVPSVRKCVDGYMDFPLCISERGKNCSGPPRTENGDITTLSEKQYRSGSSVEFTCQTYYAMEGLNRSFCNNGTWTKVPNCLDPCMIPRTELESQKMEVKDGIDVPENIFVQRGLSIELTCRTGYVLEANSSQSAFVIHCDGTPPVFPKCKEITCNSPRISNGTFRPQRTIYHDGDLIRIQCDSGFTFDPDNGEKVVECTKNGWSPPPKCIRKGCDYIRIENGRMADHFEQYKPFPIWEGQSIHFYCYEGFLPKNKQTWQTAKCINSRYDPEPKCFKMCDPTQRFYHGRIIYNYWNTYIEGNNITFVCDMGYSPANQQSSITCTKMGWSPAPRCIRPETCLKPPERDFIFNKTKSVFFPGDKLHYECKEGFEITTIDDTIACTEKGWEPTPSCVSIVCNTPFLENGTIEPREDIFQHKMVVHFKCNEEFTRVGSESAQCYHFGWSPQPPICKENVKPCPTLPIISHGLVTGVPKAVFQHGDQLEVQCEISFALYGSKIIECVDGEWASLPSCIEEVKTCGRPPTIKNGYFHNVKSSIYRHGDTMEYRCLQRHSIIGTNPAKCLHGQWEVPSCLVNPRSCTRPQYAVFQPTVQTSKQFKTNQFAKYRCGSNLHQTKCVNGLWLPEPRCKGTCPPPPQLPNAINIAEMRIYKSGEEVSFKCQEHFLLRGPQKIKCENGTWQTPPRCLDLRCKSPPEIDNGIIDIGNRTMFFPGESVEYRCSSGFEISQLNTVRCENSKWSELPVCKDVRCSSPHRIQNGQIIGEIKAKYLPREKVQYRCYRGYALLGSPFITCSKNSWTETPRCTDIGGKCGRPPYVENGDIVDSPKPIYLHSESVTYQCQHLYTMRGSPRVTCQNGRWSQTPTCRVACTASEEDMREHNIRLKWDNGDKIYSADGNVVEFECLRNYIPHPNTRLLRVNCVDGKFNYPRCIPRTK